MFVRWTILCHVSKWCTSKLSLFISGYHKANHYAWARRRPLFLLFYYQLLYAAHLNSRIRSLAHILFMQRIVLWSVKFSSLCLAICLLILIYPINHLPKDSSNIGLTREPLDSSFYYDRITLAPSSPSASRVEAIVMQGLLSNKLK